MRKVPKNLPTPKTILAAVRWYNRGTLEDIRVLIKPCVSFSEADEWVASQLRTYGTNDVDCYITEIKAYIPG